MAIAKVTHITGGSSDPATPNPQVVTMPAVAAGNRIIVITQRDLSGVTDSRGNTYTYRGLNPNGSYGRFADGMVRTPIQAGDTLSIARGPAFDPGPYLVSVWSGSIDTATPFYGAGGQFYDFSGGGQISAVTTNTGVVPRDGSLLIFVFFSQNSFSSTYPQMTVPGSGFTQETGMGVAVPGGISYALAWEWKICNKNEINLTKTQNFSPLIDGGGWCLTTYQPPQFFYGGL